MSTSHSPSVTLAPVTLTPDLNLRCSRQRHAGFTLLEVMLAIGILALLMGVMLALVEKTLEATVTLEQEQQRFQQRQGTLDLLRTTFRTMPNDVQMISRRVNDSANGTQQQIVFANAPTVLAWGNPDEMLHSSVILGTPAQTGGGLNVSIKRVPPPDMDIAPDATPNYIGLLPAEGSPQDTAVWLTLLENMKSVQWRFFDPRTVNWLDDWTDPNTRPTLVELQWQFLDETDVQRYVFWLPPITPNARPKFNQPAAGRSATTSQPTGGRPQPTPTPAR